jgi:tetratricopeptide (TPR) repeat protein
VGHRIDRETCGDRVATDAFHLTGQIVQALSAAVQPLTFCVLIGAHELEPPEALFVRFLTQALQSTIHCVLLVLCGSDEPHLPQDWIVNFSTIESSSTRATFAGMQPMLPLIPGVITADVYHLLDLAAIDSEKLIRLRGECFLVPPCLRDKSGRLPPAQYDLLSSAAWQVDWLAAYGNYWGSEDATNPTLLWDYSRTVFDAGGLNLAIRLLERAISRARTPAESAVFEIMAQGARILSGRFKDVAGVAPHDSLPPELRGWLSFTRGWGLTMLERATEAEPYLESARQLLGKSGDTDEYLYVLNISALNRLKLGDWEGAFAQEQHIRSRLDRLPAGRWQITYINSLNLARLYRRRDRLDEAERSYLEAFSTCLGVWSDSDAIYLNVCLAKLHEARQQFHDAMRAWTRAALYWVSSSVPESISNRVLNAIVGFRAMHGAGNLIDEVSSALVSYLLTNAKAAEIECEIFDDLNSASAFVRADSSMQCGEWQAQSIAGRWVFGLEGEMAPVVDTKANRRLRRILSLLTTPASNNAGVFPVIVIDDQLGGGLPETEPEMLAACLRLGVRVIRVAGQSINLDGSAGERLNASLRVRLANPVSQVKVTDGGAVVNFKRYLEPRLLSGSIAAAVRCIATLTDIPAQDFDISVLRALERQRIVELYLSENVDLATL